MSLNEAKLNDLLIVKGIKAGRKAYRRLVSLGINVGDRIRVLHSAPFGGAILVEDLDSGIKVALGQGLARKIIVEHAQHN
ncbi:MAG TPA: FeoA family protein [Candidatus Hydrothermia bacterium]|nr:ferrous iron transport protein A [Candidatus Hydrothermae bacterium]MDD3649707.1 FeoA family protein [Candidatus Hydrothermia bacterium]MDD5573311.1 FeoA family protein [Candidatus Hydrothermia bacterium]HOK23599.1 FeoA family protein [Candidatus Hydrothermia bacterium]HOL24351.1 FeoA family protein [Candidatus Hydrothermia bacterium]